MVSLCAVYAGESSQSSRSCVLTGPTPLSHHILLFVHHTGPPVCLPSVRDSGRHFERFPQFYVTTACSDSLSPTVNQ